MKGDDLSARMRAFETTQDLGALPGVHLVARLDGRCFTRLTKEVHPFEAPFDARFHDLMRRTTEHLMADSGVDPAFGGFQSDEISLLFGRDSQPFGRKLRKLISVLAGEASGRFSLLLGSVATFDCRVSLLPSAENVVDYFRWRAADAHRNALNAHCYWSLKRQGLDARGATERLSGLSVAAKHDLLFDGGINFNDLPAWQKRGSGLRWAFEDRAGEDPLTGARTSSLRRRIALDPELPAREEYANYVRRRIDEAGPVDRD